MGASEPSGPYLSPEEAKRFYDSFGSRQDWQVFYEKSAIADLIAQAAFGSARSVFEFGCGTGALAARLLRDYLPADARYVGLDLSSTMVSLARKRLQPWSERAHIHQSDGSAQTHQPNHSFDRFVSCYVFDLLAPTFIEQLLMEAHGLLVPKGRLCLVSLTFGVSRLSCALSTCWQGVWRLRPKLVGGCHPIELTDHLLSEEWNMEYRNKVIRWGVPSEVLVACAR
ncbi:MAG TPA: class I SAM-dependent methyltransferase [Terriglobales bacterium]|jgi:ubiquinone/menaquinone biosynthesis C-methylase UbiE|nr:class I SAM-dependent methyltransferase [Terriglobales bacterium]